MYINLIIYSKDSHAVGQIQLSHFKIIFRLKPLSYRQVSWEDTSTTYPGGIAPMIQQ